MGSSLTVTPAADIPEVRTSAPQIIFLSFTHFSAQEVGKRGRNLVIVNLQRTPLDRHAKLRINAKCDDVTRLLMSKLKLEIPEFRLNRFVPPSLPASLPLSLSLFDSVNCCRKILLKSSVTDEGKVRVSRVCIQSFTMMSQ